MSNRYLRSMPYLQVWSYALWRNEITRIDSNDPSITVSSAGPDYEHFAHPIEMHFGDSPESAQQPFFLTICRSHASIWDAVETLTRLNDDGFWGLSSLHGGVTLPLATWVSHPVWSGAPSRDNIDLPWWVTRSLKAHLQTEHRSPFSLVGGLDDPWRERTPLPLISAQEWCDLMDDNHLPLVVSSPTPVQDCWINPETGCEDSPIRIPSFVADAWNHGMGWEAIPLVRREGMPATDSSDFNPFGLVPIGTDVFMHAVELIPNPAALATPEGRSACLTHVANAVAEASFEKPDLILADSLVAAPALSAAPFSLYNMMEEDSAQSPMARSIDQVHHSLIVASRDAGEVLKFLRGVDHLPTCDLRDPISGGTECNCGADHIKSSSEAVIKSLDSMLTAITPFTVPF